MSAQGNGNSATDTSNLNATYLRGVQETDDDGVVLFDTLVPGHYTGRTNVSSLFLIPQLHTLEAHLDRWLTCPPPLLQHIHVMVHLNATPAANGTLLDVNASHVGQIFFDQDLLTEVEATGVYATNTQTVTTNAADGILLQEAASSDPFLEYVLLGDTVEDGLLGWLAFGIDTTLSKTVSAAATYYADGGVSNSNGGGGGGPFGGGSGPFGGN